jgi:hypothetical protein
MAAQLQREQHNPRAARRDPFARPLDHALERLRIHGLPHRADAEHVHTWHAVCPSCRVPAWTLLLREHSHGGSIDLRCAAGCAEHDIHGALERDPAEARIEAADARATEALELVEEARDLAARALELVVHAYGEPERADPLERAA